MVSSEGQICALPLSARSTRNSRTSVAANSLGDLHQMPATHRPEMLDPADLTTFDSRERETASEGGAGVAHVELSKFEKEFGSLRVSVVEVSGCRS
jgi:hypothetical protein